MLIRLAAMAATAAMALVGLTACGGSNGDPVVVRVGASPITREALTRWIAEIAPEYIAPDPPSYAACAKHQEALAVVQASKAALKEECAHEYQALKERALDSLISAYWLLDEAADRGLKVSDQEAKARLRDKAGVLGLTAAATADAELQARAEVAATKIRQASSAGEPRVTREQVASYYRQHIRRFERQELRYLDFAENFASAAAARKVKREVESGASLAKISLHEVIEGVHIIGGRFTTEAARRAIFAAKVHVLSGPIKLNRYYAIFEVTRIAPPTRQPLARVARSIQRQLEREQRLRTLSQLISSWRGRWIARTDCMAGYVVQKCRQYKGAKTPEDPLAFD